MVMAIEGLQKWLEYVDEESESNGLEIDWTKLDM